MKRWLPGAAAVWCLFFSVQAHGASFDCDKAGTKVEKLVCADEKLSKLDEELQVVYQDAYKHTADPEGLKMEQRQWLKTRNACKDAACLTGVYRARLADLKATLAEPKPCFRLLERKWPEVASGHYPVCVDFLENLNSFCSKPPICEWKVNPSIKTLALPQWEEIDPKAHLKIIQNMQQRYYRDPEDKWIPIPPDMIQRLNEGKSRMWHAWIDLDRDGQKEHIARFDDGLCNLVGVDFYGRDTRIAAVDESISQVNVKHEYLHYALGLVVHDGVAYVIGRSGNGFDLHELFSARGGFEKGMRSVCVFEYLQ